MKKLSVIIPAYQAERTLEKCLDSVLVNKLDLEILIVNDGSTDGTESICRKFAQQDSRIRMWTKENGGPGAAREFAMDHVRGDYVTFVDSDDYLEPFAYDMLANYLDEDMDILEYGYQLVNTDGSVISRHPMEAEQYSGDACGLHYARQKNTTNYLCNKIFRRSLFCGAVFSHLFAAEDAALMAQLFVYAKRCRAVPDVLYQYVMTADSLCRKPFSVKRLDNIKAYWFVTEFYEKNAPELCAYSRQKLCSVAARLYCECRRYHPQFGEYYQVLTQEYKKARNGISIRQLLNHGSMQRRMMLGLFEISPKLCAWIFLWGEQS